MIRNMLTHPIGKVPAWAWILGLLPWVWVIPLNQSFWDDWIYAAPQSFEWGLDYWLIDGAKHYLDPIFMPILYRIGPWFIHCLSIASVCVAAWSFAQVIQRVTNSTAESIPWFAPIFLVLPIFHARFSAVTVEYTIALAATAMAWHKLLSLSQRGKHLVVSMLLIIAIGVPSVAVLFPMIYLSSLLNARLLNQRYHWRLVVEHSYILMIPILFSSIFALTINDKGKYLISEGGLIAFVKGAIVLVVIFAPISFFSLRKLRFKKKDPSRANLMIAGSAVAIHIGFFPYLAVGFNPIADFLPWRLRSNVAQGLIFRAALSLIVLTLVALVARASSTRLSSGRHDLSSWLPLVAAVVFGSMAISLGPMDWESRHWLISWPFVALLFISAILRQRRCVQRSSAVSVFFVLWLATILISSEYFVDALKQRAIIEAVEDEVAPVVAERMVQQTPTLIVIDSIASTDNLNARFRRYRSHEWWGLSLVGLKSNPKQLWVLERDDFTLAKGEKCKSTRTAIFLSPDVRSSRLDVLLGRGVTIELNPVLRDICTLSIRAGWPRDREP